MFYTYGVVHMSDMWFCVQMVLCACFICSVEYMWHGVHVVHMVLCTCGVVHMIVHVVLCACGVV